MVVLAVQVSTRGFLSRGPRSFFDTLAPPFDARPVCLPYLCSCTRGWYHWYIVVRDPAQRRSRVGLGPSRRGSGRLRWKQTLPLSPESAGDGGAETAACRLRLHISQYTGRIVQYNVVLSWYTPYKGLPLQPKLPLWPRSATGLANGGLHDGWQRPGIWKHAIGPARNEQGAAAHSYGKFGSSAVSTDPSRLVLSCPVRVISPLTTCQHLPAP